MSGAKDQEPYESNAEGLVGVLIDLKTTIADEPIYSIIGFTAPAFEAVTQGEAVYSRSSDGKIGKAIANDTVDKASCIGFARTSKAIGQDVNVVTHGQLSSSNLTRASDYYLSGASAGSITTTPPTGSGKYLVRVGRASSTTQLIVKIEAPIVRN
jgi:hypothetical protein